MPIQAPGTDSAKARSRSRLAEEWIKAKLGYLMYGGHHIQALLSLYLVRVY